MIIICQYEMYKDKDGVLRMRNVPVSFCSDCRERLAVRDSRLRSFFDADGEKHLLRHRRLICRKCRKIHSELPDFIVPEKRYTADVVLGTFSSKISGKENTPCAAENSTISGWILQIFYRLWVIFRIFQNWFRASGNCEFMLKIFGFLCSLADEISVRENYGECIRCLYSIDYHICCVE